ncbi:AAA family ATPase [Mycolicibacterium sp. 018/SC-01/001]|uniref:AAA family ATPase n=1 Tax=Mycolicibacterium sp. 018/SC-01/001 TaxID=2592069 RepID=UPI00117E3084|nr:ATP-binding protein [Mycolicibacterium sp. 018/SC-01/001]TRW80914.1 AAA family ATPase [Mycolicibacterium sp. 018/SC-01/001]
MKLHRLTLTNYRGIAHRDITFPDSGVIVISGANEIGKSSMLEALDLLLDAKDRSTKKDVKLVKPTHADVGAEVTAEMSTGAYRFVYRKRFHKKPETELTILAPRREQLTGDEAHERVRAILAETVDLDLWQAQRVIQAASTSATELAGCDALSRALDVVAGEIEDTPAGAGPTDGLLVDKIEEEYRRYFTATGRPTAEWLAAITRLKNADEEVARCAAAIAEVDEAVRKHATLTADLETLMREKDSTAVELTAAQQAADTVAALTAQLEQARARAEAATSTHAASLATLTERRRTRADVEDRIAAVARLRAEADAAADDADTAREMRVAAEAAATAAKAELQRCAERLDAAQAARALVADRDEAARLTARIATIEQRQRELDSARRELADITVTATSMAVLERAAAAVERAAALVEQTSAHIEVAAAADVDVAVDGVPVPLTAGQTWTTSVSGATGIDLPGGLTVRVVAGATAADSQAALDQARGALSGALHDAGAPDLDAARALDTRRQELSATTAQVSAVLDALTADDPLQLLRSRLAVVQSRLPDDGGLSDAPTGQSGTDPTTQRLELVEATAAHQQALRDCDTHAKVVEAAGALVSEREMRAARLGEKLTVVGDELTAAQQRLAEARAAVGDDELAVTVQTLADAAAAAQAGVDRLGEELASRQPELVSARLTEAAAAAAAAHTRCDDAVETLRDVSAQLKVFGTEGRKGRLDAAETERQHAAADHERMQRRARAAQLLRTVMGRHRDALRSRYVDPFRGEVERLGRIVFGDTFEVDVDSELRIGQRTLSGRTVPYESLSGGAKEQLGIVARLAGAALVAKEDSVPVVIDDALGFTDPDRLTRMAEVFDAVAGDGQVIILTCSPQRYAGVQTARHIELAS